MKLFANKPWIGQLVRPVPDDADFSNNNISVYSYKNGKKQVTGGPGLKATQAYPKAFGQEVARCYAANSGMAAEREEAYTTVGKAKRTLAVLHSRAKQDLWSDAEVQQVIDYLTT